MSAPLPALRLPRLAVLVLALAAIPACSSSSSGVTDTDPPDDDSEPLGELVGTWEATSMVLTAVDNPEVSEDLVQNEEIGGSFTMVLRSTGHYQATLTAFNSTEVETGTVSRSGNTLTFTPDGGFPDAVEWSLSDGVLTLDGDTTFDFGQDDLIEEATLHIELERA